MRNTYVTLHNPDTGESRTFAPEEKLPRWAQEALTNPDVYDAPREEPDLIGGVDPLMERNKAELLNASEQWGVEGVSDSNTKAEIVEAIRSAGYDGDGSDLPTGK